MRLLTLLGLLFIGAFCLLAPENAFASVDASCPWELVDNKCPETFSGEPQNKPPSTIERAAPSRALYCSTVEFLTGGWGEFAAILVVLMGAYTFLSGKLVTGLIMIGAGTLITSVPSIFVSAMVGLGAWTNMTPGGFNIDAATDFRALEECWSEQKKFEKQIDNEIQNMVEDGESG